MWNGNGTFNPPPGPEFPAIANDLIRSSYYNVVINALCAGFSNTVPRDGQAPITGNIDAGTLYTIKALRKAVANGEAVRFEEFTTLAQQVAALGVPVEPFIYLNQGII